MKSILISILFSYSFLLLGADDTNLACIGKRDTTSKLAGRFCDCAGIYLNELSPVSDQKKENLKKLNELTSKRVILNDSKKLVNKYLTNIEEISKKIKDNSKIDERVKKYQETLEQSLFIKGLQSLVRNKKQFGENFDLAETCKDEKNKKSELESVCHYQNDLASKNLIKSLFTKSTIFSKTFNSMVELYQTASTNDDEIPKKINSILNSIPENLNPDSIIAVTNKIQAEVKTEINKVDDKLYECIINSISKSECSDKMKNVDDDKNKNIIQALNKFPISEGQAERFTTTDNYIKEALDNKINEAYVRISTLNKSDEESLKDFTKFNESFDYQKLGKLKDVNIDTDLLNNYQSNCQKINTTSPIQLEKTINECKSKLETFSKMLTDNDLKELDDKIKSLNSEIYGDLSKLSSPKKKLMNFVANKYNRECKSKNNKVETLELSKCGNQLEDSLNGLKINDEFYPLIGKINEAFSLDATFSKEEFKDYASACANNSDDLEKAICRNINTDKEKYKNVKTSSEILALREKYNVEYGNFPNGFRYVEKKSNAAIIGQAFIPAIPSFLQMAIMNESARFGINMMEQQAMNQKQWLWDYNVANNLWFSNMFYNPLNSTTGTISQSTFNRYGFQF